MDSVAQVLKDLIKKVWEDTQDRSGTFPELLSRLAALEPPPTPPAEAPKV